jgi:CRISPR system Cascade subunit CasC
MERERMENRMFVDVHVIQTVPPSCVNRDDTGSPKTAMYGGAKRSRVSSQSWKKAMRDYFRERFDESQMGVRTTDIVELVAEKICEIDPSVQREDAVEKADKVINASGVKTSQKKKGKEEDENSTPKSGALFFMSTKQAENMAMLAIRGDYNKKEVQEALNKGHGIDIALFGRMVADDPSLNADASAQVAHSISTHKVDNEYDYFTAIDDRSPEDNAGAGMIGTVEFNSSTLYRYATLAVHDLYKNLEGSGTVAAKATSEFVRAFVLSMPTGKQNTFANRTVPDAVFISVRNDQPVNLVAAFESPVHPDRAAGGYASDSIERLVREEKAVCSSFVSAPSKTWQIGKGMEEFGPNADIEMVTKEIEDFISGELSTW